MYVWNYRRNGTALVVRANQNPPTQPWAPYILTREKPIPTVIQPINEAQISRVESFSPPPPPLFNTHEFVLSGGTKSQANSTTSKLRGHVYYSSFPINWHICLQISFLLLLRTRISSSASMEAPKIPNSPPFLPLLPGCGFFPSEQQLLCYYLAGKNGTNSSPSSSSRPHDDDYCDLGFDVIKDVNLCHHEPFDLSNVAANFEGSWKF